MPKTIVVVPCYNEEGRLDVDAFVDFARSGETSLVFVDDGSRDGTKHVLARLAAAAPASIFVLALEQNRGKAEAVRAGMREALSRGADITGYLDADLATPLDELRRMQELLAASGCSVVLASRVRMLGSRIERKPVRHYLGRVFATFASMALHLPVYDTQCGAKLFRNTPSLTAALAEPFESRWAFDVELLSRLRLAPEEMMEMPLRVWRDVGGSRVTLGAALRMGTDLAKIWRRETK
jgi:glycosyltransferase involved in cell wall biosynthesis